VGAECHKLVMVKQVRHVVAKKQKNWLICSRGSKVPEGSILIFGDTGIMYNTMWDKPRLASVSKTSSIIQPLFTEQQLVMDTWTYHLASALTRKWQTVER